MDRLYSRPWVEKQVADAIRVWQECGSATTLAGPRYSPEEQQTREQAYDDGLRTVEQIAKRAGRGPSSRLEMQRQIVAVFPQFASVALGLDPEAIHILADGFLPMGTRFAQWAARFDPDLGMANTIQACRNAWTACGLQPLLSDRMQMTPSILGYSLLYPYSDNYLDRERISIAQKLEFSARFRDRLRGLCPTPRNRHEASVWAMVRLIEEQFPRMDYPGVYDCLLAIHEAQEESIAQLKDCMLRDGSELLRISCAKGGTSVLADACLCHGWMSDEEARLAFEWGFLLQLGDDLQDVREDLRSGSNTLFTRAATARIPLDRLVLQLLSFSDSVSARMDRLPHGSPALKGLLRMSWRSVILMAVANAHEFFSPAFLAEMESCSHFRFSFLRARHRKLSGRRGLYATVFDAFLQGGDEDLSGLPCPENWMDYSLSADAKDGVESSFEMSGSAA